MPIASISDNPLLLLQKANEDKSAVAKIDLTPGQTTCRAIAATAKALLAILKRQIADR
jgi:hypothetical protein